MSSGVQFVDHTPVKNAPYIPEDSSANASDPLVEEDPNSVPDTVFGRISHTYGVLKRYKDARLKTLKPWSEFFDRTKMSAPGKVEAFSRANKNLSYYFSNYVILAGLASGTVLVINPSFLLTMVIAVSMYFYLRAKSAAGEELQLCGRPVSYTQAWVSLALYTFLSFYYTGGSSTVFWLLISSLGTVLIHAIFREPADVEGSPLGFASYV